MLGAALYPESCSAPSVEVLIVGLISVALRLSLCWQHGYRRPPGRGSSRSGLLAFGFGLPGWLSRILFGRCIENVQRHLDTETNRTETGSRRAMARVGFFGTGVILAVPLLAALSG